jgi:hypothetical protein
VPVRAPPGFEAIIPWSLLRAVPGARHAPVFRRAPAALPPRYVRPVMRATLEAPRWTPGATADVLKRLAPALPEDVWYLLGRDAVASKDAATVLTAQYDRSSPELREALLESYGRRIGLRHKPATTSWTRYIERLCREQALGPRSRDRVLLDLLWGKIEPDAAVTQYPDDLDIVWAAVKQHGYALRLASARLRAEPRLALTAVTQNGYAFEFVDPALRGAAHRDIALAAVRSCGFALGWCHPELQNDLPFAWEAVQRHGEAIRDVGPDLVLHRGLALAAVQQTGYALRCLHPDFLWDEVIVMLAVSQVGEMLEFVPEPLRSKPRVVEAAVAAMGRAIRFAPEGAQRDKRLGLMAVSNDAFAYVYLHESLQHDLEVALVTVRQAPHMFSRLPPALQALPEVRAAAGR